MEDDLTLAALRMALELRHPPAARRLESTKPQPPNAPRVCYPSRMS